MAGVGNGVHGGQDDLGPLHLTVGRRAACARLVSCCRSWMDKMITNGEGMITIKLCRNRSA
jgi:hypothetical protein